MASSTSEMVRNVEITTDEECIECVQSLNILGIPDDIYLRIMEIIHCPQGQELPEITEVGLLAKEYLLNQDPRGPLLLSVFNYLFSYYEDDSDDEEKKD